MSNIPEEVENDPSYRRTMLYAWSRILKERDDLIKQLNKELEDLETLKFNKERIDKIIDELQSKDIILTSSRYSRVFHNVTLTDRAIVGVRSLFTLRPTLAFEGLIAVGTMLIVLGLALLFNERITELIRRVFGAVVMPNAYAATSAPAAISSALEPIQVYIIIGFAILIAFGFIWFAIVATLSKEASVRRAAMDMAKNVMLFMMGLVTGYLTTPR